MNRRDLLLTTVALLPWGQLSAQAPDTVTVADLTIAGVPHAADTAAARKSLGSPLRVQRHEEANDDGVLLTDWRYRGLLLRFDSNGNLYTASITSPTYRTARGVKVGDSISVVRRHYGAPLHGDSYAYLYAISLDDSATLGISFFFERGRIKRIITGEVISVE